MLQRAQCPVDVISAMRMRGAYACRAEVRFRAFAFADALTKTRNQDDRMRGIVLSGLPRDFPDGLTAELAIVLARSGHNLRDELFQVYSRYLDSLADPRDTPRNPPLVLVSTRATGR